MSAQLMEKKGRKAPPSHLVKIKSFSLLKEAPVEEYVSEKFEAGGYKWRLSIYPTGKDHVSIYLVLKGLGSLPAGWEVNVIVNFCAYNFLEDEYVTTQDGKVRHFHVLKTQCGIPKFIDLDTFNDPSKGYLLDDTCVFGVEVFIVNSTIKGDCLSMIHKPVTFFPSWKFDNFSTASLEDYESRPFDGGNFKWKIRIYPNGTHEGTGNSISLFLALDFSTVPISPETKLFVDFTLWVKDQVSGQHAEAQNGCKVFSDRRWSWGFGQFMSLAEFKDPKRGFLVDDSCILEAEVKVIGLITSLTDCD